MAEQKKKSPLWSAFVAIICGLIILGMAGFLFYENFVNPRPVFQGGFVFMVLGFLLGLFAVGVGLIRLLGFDIFS